MNLKVDLEKINSSLFTSRVRLKLLKLFFLNPRENYHLRLVTRIIGEQINAVRRELNNLSKIGLLEVNTYGTKKNYKLNDQFIYYNELRSLILKSQGLGFLLFLNKQNLGNITFMILTHTYLNRENSSIEDPDLLIIGEPNKPLLEEIMIKAEIIENKKLYYKIMSELDFKIAKQKNDILIYSTMVLPRSFIIGKDEDFVI